MIRTRSPMGGWVEHKFYDFHGNETDFDTWIKCRDDVGADWVVDRGGRAFVSTCFQGDEKGGDVVLWASRVTRLPDRSFMAARYNSHDEAVEGHAALLRSEAARLAGEPEGRT